LDTSKKRLLFEVYRPYRALILLFISISFFSSILDSISIGLFVPILGSLQEVQDTSAFPPALQFLLDAFMVFPPEQRLLYSMGAVIVLVILKNLFMGFAFLLGFWLASKIVADIRVRMINVLLRVRQDYFDKYQVGRLIDKVMYHSQMFQVFLQEICRSVVFLGSLFTLLVLAIAISWQLTLLATGLFSLIMIIMLFYGRLLHYLGQKRTLASQDLSGNLGELLNGIRGIKYFNKETLYQQKLNRSIHRFRVAAYQASFAGSLVMLITESLAVLAVGFLFVVALNVFAPDKSVLQIQLLPFLYILVRMVPLIKMLNFAKGNIINQLPSINLVLDLIRTDDKPFLTDGTQPFTHLKKEIRFENVSFGYKTEKPDVIRHLTLTIPKGKTTAIVGESGAGKSTLINLLLRFYDPQSGRILIDGQPLTNFRIGTFRDQVGMVSQETFIFNDTIRNNIAFGAKHEVDDLAIIRAATRAKAHEFIMKTPKGYETPLGDRGINLSVGQRQRIAIARALLKDPDILILDEATSALDNRTEKQVHHALMELCKNRTVIIIAHRLSTIQHADQIVVLKAGQVVELGSETQLMNQKGEYYQLAQATHT